MTCLMLAARDNYSKVINLLVSHGAEINIQERSGYTVCYLCLSSQSSYVGAFSLTVADPVTEGTV